MHPRTILAVLAFIGGVLADAISLSFSFSHTGDNLIFSNFFGVSIELSSVDKYSKPLPRATVALMFSSLRIS